GGAGAIRLWGADGTDRKKTVPYKARLIRISALAFSRDGRLLVTGFDRSFSYAALHDLNKADATIVFVDNTRATSGRPHHHTGPLSSAVLTPDGQGLITAGGPEYAVHLWNVARPQETARLSGACPHYMEAAWTPDGNGIVAKRVHPTPIPFDRAFSLSELKPVEADRSRREPFEIHKAPAEVNGLVPGASG